MKGFEEEGRRFENLGLLNGRKVEDVAKAESIPERES